MDSKLKIAVDALKTISTWRFGWDGDCGVTAVADEALAAIGQIEPDSVSKLPDDGQAVKSLSDAEIANIYRATFKLSGDTHMQGKQLVFARAVLAAAPLPPQNAAQAEDSK